MAKVAVASTDGINVDEHFGRSKVFLIYEVDEQGGHQFLERREVVAANDHPAIAAAELVADVEVVLAVQFGPRAEQALQEKGVLGLALTSPIERALDAYGKRGKFIRNSIKRTGPGVGYGSCGGCSGGCS